MIWERIFLLFGFLFDVNISQQKLKNVKISYGKKKQLKKENQLYKKR